jgi:hypothetical protein
MLLMNAPDIRGCLEAGHYRYIEFALSQAIEAQDQGTVRTLYREVFMHRARVAQPAPALAKLEASLETWHPVLELGAVFVKHSRSSL